MRKGNDAGKEGELTKGRKSERNTKKRRVEEPTLSSLLVMLIISVKGMTNKEVKRCREGERTDKGMKN